MALDPVPWVIDGGAVHSAAVARVAMNVATGNGSGVAAGGDLAVKALAVAGGSVRVLPGAAVIRNSYANQISQSYIGRVISETNVAIAPTSGATRSDMVILRIDDPQYGGSTPSDVANGPYLKLEVISNVGAGVTEVPGTITYPAIPLARIDIPASTSVITSGMVNDIRKLNQPRKDRTVKVYQPGGDVLLSAVSPAFANWPRVAGWDIPVPTWASKAIVIGQVAGTRFETANGKGDTKIRMGVDGSAQETQTTRYDLASVGGFSRQLLLTGGELTVPIAYKGTTQTFAMRGTIVSGTGTTRAVADVGSTMILDVEFVEGLYIP